MKIYHTRAGPATTIRRLHCNKHEETLNPKQRETKQIVFRKELHTRACTENKGNGIENQSLYLKGIS